MSWEDDIKKIEKKLFNEKMDVEMLEMSIKGKLDIEHGVYLSSIIKEFT